MKLKKYISLVNKLSKIEGQKEPIKGQYNLSAKLYKRGDINEDEFMNKSDSYVSELRALDAMKRSALKEYALAA